MYKITYSICFHSFRFFKKVALRCGEIQKEGQCYITYFPGIIFSRCKGLEYRRLVWLNNAEFQKIKNCLPDSYFNAWGPKFLFNSQPNQSHEILPAIWLYHFKNAYVVANSSHIVTDEFAFIERVSSINSALANYSTGHVFDHSDNYAIVRKIQHYEIENAVFLGGNGSENYYHWLIEILPKLQFFIEEGILSHSRSTLLINSRVQEIPSFQTLLDQALKDQNVQITYMDDEYSYKVKNLYHLSTPNNIVFNTRNQISSPANNFIRKESLDYVRDLGFSLNSNYKSGAEGPKRIFLARRNSLRSYNQAEIFKLLEKYGFKEVYLETLSVQKQVQLFRNAEFIVGPTGAAWSNLIFCQKQPKCLCWMAEQIGDFSAFANLAKYSGADLNYITYKAESLNIYRSDYVLDKNLLLQALIKLAV